MAHASFALVEHGAPPRADIWRADARRVLEAAREVRP